MIKILQNDFDPLEFDKVSPHPMQSWKWGVARTRMGVEVVRIGEYQKDALKNVFQITLHPIPYTKLKVGYLPRSVMPSLAVLKFIHDWAKKSNVIFIKLEPYIENGSKTKITNSAFVESSHPLFPSWTQVLDIDRSEEEILEK